jgi:S1-C subfamily serine protease
MKRSVKASLLTLAVIAVVLIATILWGVAARRSGAATPVSTPGAVHQAVTGAVDFVKNRVTGGVGVAVAIDSQTKLPVVGAVAIGSPADEAGLHTGDIITKVGGITTTGLFVKQVVDNLRGFTGGSVPVTVLRGTNQIDFKIRRTSMQSLQEKRFSPYQ